MSLAVVRTPIIPVVSALPSNPYNGQEVYFEADATNGVYWHLVYRSVKADGTSDGSSYKWHVLGGGDMFVETLANQAISGTSYADGSTVGPSITAPLAGDYLITGTGIVKAGSSAAIFCSLKIGAAATSDNDRLVQTNATAESTIGRTIQRTVSAASTVLKMQYRVTASTGNIDFRTLAIRPIRVG